jgi:hypothetical protein
MPLHNRETFVHSPKVYAPVVRLGGIILHEFPHKAPSAIGETEVLFKSVNDVLIRTTDIKDKVSISEDIQLKSLPVYSGQIVVNCISDRYSDHGHTNVLGQGEVERDQASM